ncbi:MAG TPA: polysaccharide biosynthesis tyrosine autokinase [Fervidobacterium sp.]|nr:polysaccharide biosynthesis tyrosine autokinase [Fervidobacterium sp.]
MSTGEKSQELTLKDIITIFKRRVNIFFIVLVITVAITAVYIFTAKPVYSATARLRISTSRSSGISLSQSLLGIAGSSSADITTEIEIMKSRTNVGRVIDKLNLIDFFQKRSGKTINREDLISSLQASIQFKPVENSNIVDIVVEDLDPELSAKIANELANSYIELSAEIEKQGYSSSRETLEKQLPIVQKNLDDLDTRIRDFKEKNNIFSVSEQANLLLERFSDYDTQYTNLQLELDEVKLSLKSLDEQLKALQKDIVSSENITSNPVISSLRERITDLNIQLSALLETYSEDSTQVQNVRKQLSEAQSLLSKEVEKVISSKTMGLDPVYTELYIKKADNESRYQIIQATLSSLEIIRKKYDDILKSLPTIEQELVSLERNRKVQEAIYVALLQKLGEISLNESSVSSKATIFELAEKPLRPTKPNKKLTLAIGSILGVFLGILAAFVNEVTDKKIRSSEDITKLINRANILGETKGNEGTSKDISETFVALSTNLNLNSERLPKLICISSAREGEGKTFVAFNLAKAYSMAGYKTLLVDLNLRNPSIHKLPNIAVQRDLGVSDAILENMDPEIIIRNLPDGLDVITSGSKIDNSVLVFNNPRITEFLKSLANKYDRVIVDTAPINGALETLLLAKIVDGFVLVVKPNESLKLDLVRINHQIVTSGGTVLGIIVNNKSKS